jgi:sulfate adenylyltransferase subunit 1 (EFTu-like GTPase family)
MKNRLEKSDERLVSIEVEVRKLEEQRFKDRERKFLHELSNPKKVVVSEIDSQIAMFDIIDYKDKTFDEMIEDYCTFHKRMIDGKIPPKYLYLEINSNVGGGTDK